MTVFKCTQCDDEATYEGGPERYTLGVSTFEHGYEPNVHLMVAHHYTKMFY